MEEGAKEKDLNTCPKCNQPTWRINAYIHVTAPGRFYGNLGKAALKSSDVKVDAVLWGAVNWWCDNPECLHHVRGAKRVRLVSEDE